jgi:hypothetical protein
VNKENYFIQLMSQKHSRIGDDGALADGLIYSKDIFFESGFNGNYSVIPNGVNTELKSPGNQNFSEYAGYFLDAVVAALIFRLDLQIAAACRCLLGRWVRKEAELDRASHSRALQPLVLPPDLPPPFALAKTRLHRLCRRLKSPAALLGSRKS